MNSMQKGVIEHAVIVKIILALIFLMVGLSFLAIVGSGKGGELAARGAKLMDALSPCKDMGQQDFAQLMGEMKKIYEACKNDETKCGYDTCEKMTLKLNTPGAYHEIGSDVLYKYQMDYFNRYDFFFFRAPERTAITCDGKNGLIIDDEISASYKGGSYVFNKIMSTTSSIYADVAKTIEICHSYDKIYPSFFAVGDGSKITLKAVYNKGIIFSDTDLQITVDGGQFTNKQTAPLPPACTAHSQCDVTKWGICNGGTCTYDYCKTPSAKCKAITATCTLTNSRFVQTCTTTPAETVCGGPDYFENNANGIKTQIYSLKQNSDGTFELSVLITYTRPASLGGGTSSKTAIIPEDAYKWFGYASYGGGYYTLDYTNANDPSAYLSLGLTAKPRDVGGGTYTVNIIQGCY